MVGRVVVVSYSVTLIRQSDFPLTSAHSTHAYTHWKRHSTTFCGALSPLAAQSVSLPMTHDVVQLLHPSRQERPSFVRQLAVSLSGDPLPVQATQYVYVFEQRHRDRASAIADQIHHDANVVDRPPSSKSTHTTPPSPALMLLAISLPKATFDGGVRFLVAVPQIRGRVHKLQPAVIQLVFAIAKRTYVEGPGPRIKMPT